MAVMAVKNQAIDQRMVKALGHPLRVSILTLLNEKVASPNQLAQELDEPLGNVSYHTRMLASLGVIELVDTQPRRGAVEHFYRALQRPFFSDEDWQELPVSTRRSVYDAILRQAWKDVGFAAANGGFDRSDTHVSRTPLMLDADGHDAVVALLAAVVEKAMEIQAQSAGRMVGAEAQGMLTEMVVIHFEPPSTGAADDPRPATRRKRKSTAAQR